MLPNWKKKNDKKTAAAPQSRTAPWWINPCWYAACFILPFFLITVFTAEPYMLQLGQRVNNLTSENIALGLLSIFCFGLGALAFASARPRTDSLLTRFDLTSVNRALTLMGTMSFVCHLIYFSSVIAHPEIISIFLAGGGDAMFVMRGALEQIPGITSFMSSSMPFYALYGSVVAEGNRSKISSWNKKLFVLIFVLTGARAIFGAERLALIEALVCFSIPIALYWRKTPLRTFMPFMGVGGLFCLFSVGEYFRSWQHYQAFFDSFWEFISVRFFGYFATSFNNGTGILTYYPPIGYPDATVTGFYQLFNVFGITLDNDDAIFDRYLNTYATPEFNNWGGIYVPYMDFGIAGGAMVMLLVGIISGALYKRFLDKTAIGLVLFPCWFVGILDLMRVWLWGSSRFVPVLIVSLFTALFVLKGKTQLAKLGNPLRRNAPPK